MAYKELHLQFRKYKLHFFQEIPSRSPGSKRVNLINIRQASVLEGGRLLVDIKGEFSWTK